MALKIWARRHRDLARARNQAACRLHAAPCDLVPGGIPREIAAAQAAWVLGQVRPPGAAAQARCELAAELVADTGRLDTQLREASKKFVAALKASGTTVTECSVSGRSAPAPSSATSAACGGSPAGITSRPTTAPPRSRCPRAAGRSAGCRCAAVPAS